MKFFSLTVLFFLRLNAASAGSQNGNAFPNLTDVTMRIEKNSTIMLDSIPPDTSGMRNVTSHELSKEMVPGWNVGNSLEAIGGETAWGNPLITQKLIDSIKAAGFNTVRIPVAWSNGMNPTTYQISPTLMARVEEVVNYVLGVDMYAIINIHWDGGWMQPTYALQDSVNDRLAALWQQIAVHFRDYDDHLIFAGTNEVMVEGNYGSPTAEYVAVQNSFNQTFVSTVRSTGGKNVYRFLAVQGFNTNINYTVSTFIMPADVVTKKLMVEVHYYDPYDFTINENSTLIQWGKIATSPSQTQTWANEPYVDAQFKKMKNKYIDSGYAVILGEYGTLARLNLGNDSLNALHAKNRRYYTEYVTYSLVKHGLVPVLWDNGGTGNNGMGVFNRHTGAQAYSEIVKAIMDVVDTTNFSTNIGMFESYTPPATFTLFQNYPNPFNPATNISFSLPSNATVSLKVFDMIGREVATIVSGEMQAGYYTKRWDASNVSSGIYFCRLVATAIPLGQAGAMAETKKIMLLK